MSLGQRISGFKLLSFLHNHASATAITTTAAAERLRKEVNIPFGLCIKIMDVVEDLMMLWESRH
jgi:hypothetical protein